jgi:hypothetical protein
LYDPDVLKNPDLRRLVARLALYVVSDIVFGVKATNRTVLGVARGTISLATVSKSGLIVALTGWSG